MTLNSRKSYQLIPSYRLLVILLTCLGISILTALQATMTFGWVCMVEKPSENRTVDNVPTDLCKYNPQNNSFFCATSIRRHVFAADGFGLLAMLLPLGYVIDKYGAKYFLATGLVLSSLVSVIIPPTAEASFAGVIALRVVFGFSNAAGFPSIYYICSRWSMKKHLGISLALVGAGYELGPLIFFFLSGLQCQNLGWQYIFYISGAVSVLAVFPWLVFCSNDPTENTWISEAEKRELLIHRQPLPDPEEKRPKVPWLKLFGSPAVLSCCVSGMAHGFVFTFIRKYSPVFYRDLIGLSIEANSISNVFPYAAQLISRFAVGPLSDILKFKSQTTTLKIFNTVGYIGITACFLGLGFLSQSAPKAVPIALVSMTMFFLNICVAGWQKAPLFLAPQFSSTVATVVLMATAACAAVTPYVVDAVAPPLEATANEWRHMFFIGAGVALLAASVFLVFGKGELRKWADTEKKENFGHINLSFIHGVESPTECIEDVTVMKF